jgi:hypothetical protein
MYNAFAGNNGPLPGCVPYGFGGDLEQAGQLCVKAFS